MGPKYVATAICVLVLSGLALGQESPLWRGLRAGPYPVGFRVVWEYDRSRTWQRDKDYLGNELDKQASRPIRISMWYPAKALPAAVPMPYSGYLRVAVPDPSFERFKNRIEEYDLESVRGYFMSEEAFKRLLETPTAALPDALSENGLFPIVAYSLGQNDHTLENTVLFEFLASHGYIVITVPQLGTSPRRFHLLVHDPVFYEAQVRDLEFALGRVSALPNADPEKLAFMGHSRGGIYALLAALRNSKVDAVIGLDPSYMSQEPSYYYAFWEAPWYDAARLRAPVLVMYKTESNPRREIIESLLHSDRYLIHFPNLVHGDFNSSPMIQMGAAERELDPEDLEVRPMETGELGHETVARCVLDFLDANLKGGRPFAERSAETLEALPSGFARTEFLEGLKAPDEEQFVDVLNEEGLEQATALLRSVAARYPGRTIIREDVMRRIGDEAGYYGNAALALDVYRLNVEAHPESARAHIKLAETYLDNGDASLAVKHLERALDLEPENAEAKAKLELLRH